MKVIVLDTETANSLEEPICYDCGWAVIDLDTKETIKTGSFAVAEILLDKELMSSAYFAEKIPQYWEEIKKGERTLARFSTICRKFREDCHNFEITEVYAHNMRFDYRSCTLSQRYITSSKYRYFFPYGIKICDTLKMARQAFSKEENYIRFCDENGYRTSRNQLRMTAEILYRYISGDNEFTEEHKGLADVLIEKEILFACRERGVVNGSLWE